MSTKEQCGFSLCYEKGWAILTVFPPQPHDRKIYADDVLARMRLLQIPPVSTRAIQEILDHATGCPERLIEWPRGSVYSARVFLNVSLDAMRVELTIQWPKPGGSPLSRAQVNQALSRAGIQWGIDEEAITKVLSVQESESCPIIVATGKPAQEGKAARLDYFFNINRGKPWKEIEGGRIDLKELHFIQNCQAGTLVAKEVPSQAPQEGKNVFGERLKASVAPPEDIIRAGKGVEKTDAGFFATRDGNILLEKGVMTVEPLVLIETVDYSSGNIDFDGSVIVAGTVADGFSVKASGDLQINRTVGRVHLEAGRNLLLRGGVVGDKEGRCVVKGSLYAKFLESTRIDVSGDVVIREAVRYSDVYVGGNFILIDGRGEFIGGIAVIGKNMLCRHIGSFYSGETQLYLGVPPERFDACQNLATDLKVLREKLDALDRQFSYLDRPQSQGAENRVEKIKISQLIKSGTEKMKTGALKLKKMRSSLKPLPGTLLAVKNRVYPGTSLFFGLDEYVLGNRGLEEILLQQGRERVMMHGYSFGKRSGVFKIFNEGEKMAFILPPSPSLLQSP